MPSTDIFDATTTSVEYPWPKGVTPLERIMLSAHGDLQRIISAFFARPVIISPIYVNTRPPLDASALPPSPTCPTTQKRQVHLVCAGRTVCIATSSVTITSARCAKLFLEEGYAIGQIFRKMGVVPEFELLEVGFAGEAEEVDGLYEKSRQDVEPAKRKIWRRYILKIEGFEADIVEVFPDRDMFTRGEEWLAEPQLLTFPDDDADFPWTTPSLSPTETLVHLDEALESCLQPPVEPVKESWSESSGGLLRFMAVFIAVLLLLNVPKEGDRAGTHIGSTLFGRIARLLDVQVYQGFDYKSIVGMLARQNRVSYNFNAFPPPLSPPPSPSSSAFCTAMPVPICTVRSLSRRSSTHSINCTTSPSTLKGPAVLSQNCVFPAEILELIVHEAFESDRSFASVSGFASASYAFRQIALRYVYTHVHIGSLKRWSGGMPDVRDLARWVRSLCGVAQALAVPEAVGLRSFHLLRTVHVAFKSETLANIHRIIFPLLDNLPSELTDLSLTDLPDVNIRVLDKVALKFQDLRRLELNCAERLDTSCCWECFEESSSCIWHSPIPELHSDPEEFTITVRNTLRPLTKLQHLHLGIFLSPEDIVYEHLTHAHDFCEAECVHTKPFGPEWCKICFDRHAVAVRLTELQATLMLAQALKELCTMTWASFFGRQLQEMDGRQTTIWISRKDGSIRVRRSPWTSKVIKTKS